MGFELGHARHGDRANGEHGNGHHVSWTDHLHIGPPECVPDRVPVDG